MNKLFRIIWPQKNPQVVRKQYGIPQSIHLKIQLTSEGLVATSEDLPGFITNARNPQELLKMVNDGILEYFDVPKLEADYVYDYLNLEGFGHVYLKKQEQYA